TRGAFSISTSTPARSAPRLARAADVSSGATTTARPDSPTFAATAAIRGPCAQPMNATRSPSFTLVMLTSSVCVSARRTNGFSTIALVYGDAPGLGARDARLERTPKHLRVPSLEFRVATDDGRLI